MMHSTFPRHPERSEGSPATGTTSSVQHSGDPSLRFGMTWGVTIRLLLLASFFLSNTLLAKPIELSFWHSMAGSLGAEVNQLAEGFNKSQQNYVIKPVYKGEYTDTLTSFAAAFRADHAPNIVQIFEVGTATMLTPAGIIKPLQSLLQETGISLPTASFLPAVRAFYSKEGELQAMPFNTSVPVMFYNADLLAKVGVKDFPKTWQQLETLAFKLQKAGSACVYTTAYPAWIHIESFAALHGLSSYNHPAILHHIERLKKWQMRHYFEYGGRANDATNLFTSSHCVIFSQSSGAYHSLQALVPFNLGVAPLPIDASFSKGRHNNIIGGAALWAISGQKPEEYRGIALFYQYLAKPTIQQHWYQHTGYLPLEIPKDSASKILNIAEADLAKKDKRVSVNHRIPQNQIRAIHDEVLEAIFSGMKLPEVAIQDAFSRANLAQLRFTKNTA